MKVFWVIVSLCTWQLIMAADVQWNCLDIEYSSQYDENKLTYISCYEIGGIGNLSLGFFVESVMTSTYVVINEVGCIANFSGNIMQADRGDLVSEATIRHQPLANYFDHSWIDDEKIGGTHELRAKANSDFYLMFVVSDGIAGPNYAYGWVNLGVDRRGNLSLLGSAIDLDGGPMIVGGGSASPEPSGVLLLLLGMGALGLKRVESGKRKMESGAPSKAWLNS